MNGNTAERYDYEMDSAVADKIAETKNPHRLIPENALKGLQPVDLSHSRYRIVKRALDIVLSGLALAVLFVPMALISLAIFIDDPGRVFFRQNRVGMKGKSFKIYNVRCMAAWGVLHEILA